MKLFARHYIKKTTWILFIFLYMHPVAFCENRPFSDSLFNRRKTEITLLVFSAGNHSFQIFTDSLYQQLKKDLVPFNVKTTFFYLGDTKDDPIDNLGRKLMQENFDAFIILDFNYRKKSNLNLGILMPRNEYYSKENLQVYYFDESNFLAPLWETTFKVNIETTNPSDYINISQNLIVNLRNDGIISKASN